MPADTKPLYEQDFVRWTEQQAGALRKACGLGTNLPLDWENLAEEIDGLGRSQRNELASRLAVILEHLIKLENSAARDPRAGWMDTIDRERANIERLLRHSPSLRNEIARMIGEEIPRAARLAARSLLRHGEVGPAAAARLGGADYSEAQILGDWFPADRVAGEARG